VTIKFEYSLWPLKWKLAGNSRKGKKLLSDLFLQHSGIGRLSHLREDVCNERQHCEDCGLLGSVEEWK
jgi:hypothetical protein